MMSSMHQQLVPEHIPNAPQLAARISDLFVQIVRLKARNSRCCFAVHYSKCGSEPFHGLRPFDVRRLNIKPYRTVLNPNRNIGFYFSQVPRNFAQRSPTCVWTEIVLIAWQRPKERDRAICFLFPAP